MPELNPRTVSSLPLLGWTERLHPKLGELSPAQVAVVALGRAERYIVEPQNSRHQLTKTDPETSAQMLAIREARTTNGTHFMQIGAHNGQFDDPFADSITNLAWHAILVEPQPDVFAQLQARYESIPRVTTVNAAVSNDGRPLVLWRANIAGYSDFGSAIASVDKEQVEREVKRNLGTYMLRKSELVPVSVPTITLPELFATTQTDPAELEFFATDTEGMDACIVKSLIQDVGAEPALVQWEHFHVQSEEAASTDRNLIALGYQLIKTHKDTLAYK